MSAFKGRYFSGEVVLWSVRWYCRYGISYRDLEQMMAKRGVRVDHATIYRWVQTYAPEMKNGCASNDAGQSVAVGVLMRRTSRSEKNRPTSTGP